MYYLERIKADIMSFNMEDPSKLVDEPSDEVFRVVYRRRGSDLIIGATKDDKIQVTRWNHKYKKGKSYQHDVEEFSLNKEGIKKEIEGGKYKLVLGGEAKGKPKPDDK